MSITTIADLDCAFVKNALFFVIPKIMGEGATVLPPHPYPPPDLKYVPRSTTKGPSSFFL